MRIELFDDLKIWKNFWPLSLTRPLSELRIGILTISEKYEQHLECDVYYVTEDHLQSIFPKNITEENILFINSSVIPDTSLIKEILSLNEGESLVKENVLIAYRRKFGSNKTHQEKEYLSEIKHITYITDIIGLQKEEIASDYKLLTAGKKSDTVHDPHTITYGSDIFIEEGANIKSAILNAEEGPIYIGKNCKVEEGAIIKGPFGMLDDSIVSIGAKIRPGVSLGPKCVVGGEVKNSVFHSNTNKAHDGYMGDSIIGAWCNFGASTTVSNLKNNWSSVKLAHPDTEEATDSGLHKVGLIMGDHCMTAIGTLFNTGSMIGMACNIFQHGVSQNYIPSFSWGDSDLYELEKLKHAIERMMASKNAELNPAYKNLIEVIFKNEVE